MQKWRRKNKVRYRKSTNEWIKKYYRKNKSRYRLYAQKRLATKKKGGELTIKIIQLVYEDNIKRFGTLTCYLCLKPIEFRKDTLEHKKALSRGGTNEYNNLAIACGSCNSSKGIKTEKEFRRNSQEVLTE